MAAVFDQAVRHVLTSKLSQAGSKNRERLSSMPCHTMQYQHSEQALQLQRKSCRMFSGHTLQRVDILITADMSN